MHTDTCDQARWRRDTSARLRFPRDRLSCVGSSARAESLPSGVMKLSAPYGNPYVFVMGQWGANIISEFALLPRWTLSPCLCRGRATTLYGGTLGLDTMQLHVLIVIVRGRDGAREIFNVITQRPSGFGCRFNITVTSTKHIWQTEWASHHAQLIGWEEILIAKSARRSRMRILEDSRSKGKKCTFAGLIASSSICDLTHMLWQAIDNLQRYDDAGYSAAGYSCCYPSRSR